MTAHSFNWGILGPGRIARQFAEDLKVIDGAKLYAVASTSLDRAKAFADQYGGAKSYSAYADLVNDPNVDGVYIATPHRFHFENTMLCLQAGKPVLCEKPLTVNAVEARTLITTARGKKVFLMEALWTRYLPIYSIIREWLDQKAIGEISLLAGSFGFNAPKDKQERWLNPDLAGGALLDTGIYPIAVSQWILNAQPASSTAFAQISATGVDVLTAVLLRYDNGAIAQFHSSFLGHSSNDFWIYGSTGSIRIHPEFWGATKASLIIDDREETALRPLRSNGFEYQTEEAMRCIRAGLPESPGMSHADTLANMELMDSIRSQIKLRYPFEQ